MDRSIADLQKEFDAAYWASQPPELRARLDDDLQRAGLRAVQLAAKGFIVDVPIMVWGWDPYLTMKLRSDFGYTWVPSALQPPPGNAPGAPISATGIAYDPLKPPPGSIRVSLDPKDYPPFDPPKPPVVLRVDQSPVGPQNLGTTYYAMIGDPWPDGKEWDTDPRGKFKKHVVNTPFGLQGWWEKVPDKAPDLAKVS